LAAFGDDFQFTLITNDARLAGRADRAGVNRIGVDLEQLGKAGRQAGEDTRLSYHTAEELAPIGRAMRRALPFARINPIHSNSQREIETVLAHDARVLMLPFFHSAGEVQQFVRLIAGRARTVILVETGAACEFRYLPATYSDQ
jgi:citrate lyase beta subunit